MCSPAPGECHGGTLTLSADGPLPAFLADTREGLAVDHTGTPVMARVRQAAAISGYVTGRPFPASGTHALESIPFVVAGATIVARGLVTLAVTWRRKSQ